jgi:hypothetical protein
MYESEDQLQALLEESPELLLGETADSEKPANYLLIAREVGVPDAQGGSDRWFLDHLFLDGEGVPTLVEVKRSSDSRIRREVVGQMLDYAANILAHWPPERMRAEFEATYEEAGASVGPVERVREISGAEYEEYWTRVKTNLAAKRLRLVFVADHIPTTLQTIVEFLNEQMRAAEVLAVEVKQHKGNGFTVLTAQLIGWTSTAQRTKFVTERREWDEPSTLEALRKSAHPEAATVAERLFRWADRQGLDLLWPPGKIGGPYILVTDSEGEPTKPFGIGTDGRLWLYLRVIRSLPPFDQDEALLDFIRSLATAAGMRVEDDVVDKHSKGFPLHKLYERCDDAVAALDRFVEQASQPGVSAGHG